jgi:phosphatidylinositol 3-kinase
VDWNDSSEVKQVVEELLPVWVDIDVADALELLGPSFRNKVLRQFAVQQLDRADDDDLHLYLLQLVQAIKFEDIADKGAYESSLVQFLTRRAVKNPQLGYVLYWYLMTECDDKKHAPVFNKVFKYTLPVDAR